MGQKYKPRGLEKRGTIWHIKKTINGRRIRESTGTDNLKEAEQYLAHRMEQLRKAEVYGVRPRRTFQEAGLYYIKALCNKPEVRAKAIKDAEYQIKLLNRYIGHKPLDSITMQDDDLKRFIQERTKIVKRRVNDPKAPHKRILMEVQEKVKIRTINDGLATLRRICNLAATEWIDEYGLTWLRSAPKIKLLRENDKRLPRTLSWEEQDQFFGELADHLHDMALFKVNAGCRSGEVCCLRWEWEYSVPQINATFFILPKAITKNKEGRIVVLNRIARQVIDKQRGKHAEYVFSYKGNPVSRMYNTAWKRARKITGFDVRVHDLRHTFGERLRAADVSLEDRQDLLGHKNNNITSHYSPAQIQSLVNAVNMLCERKKSSPVLRLIRSNVIGSPPKLGAS